MTVVIADSSPLNYFALIGSVDVLHRLYGVVVVPKQEDAPEIEPPKPIELPLGAPTNLRIIAAGN